MSALPWEYDDGGRKAAGHKGNADDCVTRAAAIASGKTYSEVAALVRALAKEERHARGRLGAMAACGMGSTVSRGVLKPTCHALMDALGATWTPTMHIGQGCKFHLAVGELPAGRLVASVSKHLVAVVDGVVRDTSDPTRSGTRCVYGYWTFS